jgi:hypothetical protein
MAAATPNQAGTLRWRPGDVVVTRHVRVPSAKLVQGLPDPDGAPRRLPLPGGEVACSASVSPPAPTVGEPVGSSGCAGGDSCRFHPSRIEIIPWSHSASELRIIPLTRFAHL